MGVWRPFLILNIVLLHVTAPTYQVIAASGKEVVQG
jgi:hypothetical protein